MYDSLRQTVTIKACMTPQAIANLAQQNVVGNSKSPLSVVIEGEQATPLKQLPQSWQDIFTGKSNTKLSNAEDYVKMAQLFLHKMSKGDVDLFNESEHLQHLKPAFCQIFGS
ncbi:MAG: hypothetical protein AAFR37_08965, partial [Cyanobacteria bacterium J06628_3]